MAALFRKGKKDEKTNPWLVNIDKCKSPASSHPFLFYFVLFFVTI